jgi:hypothetical protein
LRKPLQSFGPFTLTNSSCTKAARVLDVSGLPNSHVAGVAVASSAFKGVESTANVLNHVDNVEFTNVTVNGKPV